MSGRAIRQYRLFCFALTVLGLAACGDGPGTGVASDIDLLEKVILHAPSPDDRREIYSLYDDSPFLVLNYWDGMIRQHRRLTRLLGKNGVRTLDLVDLLEDAIENARSEGKLEEALAEIFPDHFPGLKDRIGRIHAAAVLGRVPELTYHYDKAGGLDPLVPWSGALMFVRDFAVSTPRGVIITNSRYRERKFEHRIGRFLFRFADELRTFPVVFDAEAEGVRCEGGDIIVQDEKTLLMGVDNRSDREAARKIARTLGLDVLGVSLPARERFSGVNMAFMHLDTVFGLVDRKKALTVPYLFLKEYAAGNPIVKYLQGIEGRPKKTLENGELELAPSLLTAIKAVDEVGWLTLFRAGTGEAVDLGKKLGDHLLELGYEIIPIGGERGEMREDQYLEERVLYELSLQAANVVQLAPGRIIAMAHNTHTNRALERSGVRVLTFEGKYLADSLGGPHCLTMPLVRAR